MQHRLAHLWRSPHPHPSFVRFSGWFFVKLVLRGRAHIRRRHIDEAMIGMCPKLRKTPRGFQKHSRHRRICEEMTESHSNRKKSPQGGNRRGAWMAHPLAAQALQPEHSLQISAKGGRGRTLWVYHLTFTGALWHVQPHLSPHSHTQ